MVTTRATRREDPKQEDDFALLMQVVTVVKTLAEDLAALREEVRNEKLGCRPTEAPIGIKQGIKTTECSNSGNAITLAPKALFKYYNSVAKGMASSLT